MEGMGASLPKGKELDPGIKLVEETPYEVEKESNEKIELVDENKLRIKKAGKKVVSTGKKVVASTKKNVTKVATEGKKLLNKPSPTKRPVTTGQKLAAKGNQVFKKTGKYIKNQV